MRRVVLFGLAGAAAALAAGCGGESESSVSRSVTILRVAAVGGAPPSTAAVGAVSTSSGRLVSENKFVGTWRYRCTYIDPERATHHCSVVHAFSGEGEAGEGTITTEGLFYRERTPPGGGWYAISGATGDYEGVVGAMRALFKARQTKETFFLIRRR